MQRSFVVYLVRKTFLKTLLTNLLFNYQLDVYYLYIYKTIFYDMNFAKSDAPH